MGYITFRLPMGMVRFDKEQFKIVNLRIDPTLIGNIGHWYVFIKTGDMTRFEGIQNLKIVFF